LTPVARFKLSGANVTLVFDRGIISDDNAQLIKDAKMKYISALDRNQIAGCGIDLSPFKKIASEDVSPKPDGFKKYDDQLYFYDHGVIDDNVLSSALILRYLSRTVKTVKRRLTFLKSI